MDSGASKPDGEARRLTCNVIKQDDSAVYQETGGQQDSHVVAENDQDQSKANEENGKRHGKKEIMKARAPNDREKELGKGRPRDIIERKAKVKCAAANDEEDFGGLFELKEKRTSVDTASSDVCAPMPTQGDKKKEFEWMDSDDEVKEEICEVNGDDEKGDEGGDIDEENSMEVSVETLDAVQSFGRMMLLAPSLQKRLRSGSMPPADVTAACRALARTKFFDCDIFQDLYTCLQKLLSEDTLDGAQTHDAILCLKALNAYDREVFSSVARAFRAKTRAMDVGMRQSWLEVFKGFAHAADADFLQLLEVPPLVPTNPSFRKIRCFHHSRGTCVLEALCTFSHDSRAPLSLADGCSEDWWRSKPLVMTQNQKTLGFGVYGTSSNADMRNPPIAPSGWCMPGGSLGINQAMAAAMPQCTAQGMPQALSQGMAQGMAAAGGVMVVPGNANGMSVGGPLSSGLPMTMPASGPLQASAAMMFMRPDPEADMTGHGL